MKINTLWYIIFIVSIKIQPNNIPPLPSYKNRIIPLINQAIANKNIALTDPIFTELTQASSCINNTQNFQQIFPSSLNMISSILEDTNATSNIDQTTQQILSAIELDLQTITTTLSNAINQLQKI